MLTTELLAALIAEAAREFQTDQAGDRDFAGHPAFAAEYVYYRAVRDDKLAPPDDPAGRRAEISEILAGMPPVQKPKKQKGRKSWACKAKRPKSRRTSSR